jgi:glycosyltransferase involved in cell wall biosynthesis
MKLLSITHYSAFLGANRSLLHLLEGLRDQKGVEVQVWCPSEGAFTEALRKSGIAYKVLPFANFGYTLRSVSLWLFPFKYWQNNQKMPFFEAELRSFSPDVIHSNSSLVALGALLAERTGLPHVWHVREFGWSDYQVVFPLGNRFMQAQHAKASAFIAISDSIRQRVLGHTGAKPPVFTIFNGIGTAENIVNMPKKLAKNFSESEKNNTENAPEITNFLIIGLLHPSKNQLQALRAFRLAFAQNPNLRLEIVGEGRKIYTLQLRFLVRFWHLQNVVRFSGYLADPNQAYARADAVLMCSPNEGMGRVTAEAMARKKVVVGYNGGATPEIITDGKNGFLYNGTDADLCEKMLFIPKNQTKMHEISENAHQTALDKFSDEAYTAACFAVFLSSYTI